MSLFSHLLGTYDCDMNEDVVFNNYKRFSSYNFQLYLRGKKMKIHVVVLAGRYWIPTALPIRPNIVSLLVSSVKPESLFLYSIDTINVIYSPICRCSKVSYCRVKCSFVCGFICNYLSFRRSCGKYWFNLQHAPHKLSFASGQDTGDHPLLCMTCILWIFW